jgi:hypothetical protein
MPPHRLLRGSEVVHLQWYFGFYIRARTNKGNWFFFVAVAGLRVVGADGLQSLSAWRELRVQRNNPNRSREVCCQRDKQILDHASQVFITRVRAF